MVEDLWWGASMEPKLDRTKRLAELRRSLRKYRDRYGEVPDLIDVSKANSALSIRQRRLNRLREEEERITQQIQSMLSEMRRIERWLEFCLEDAIERTKREQAEAWSPCPIMGYRLWWIEEGRLCGVKLPWKTPTLTATCLRRGDLGEIPHSDGSCGRLGCGVYAAKTVDPLYRDFNVWDLDDFAIGLVALTGKVVEHDDGYRAAAATVVALGARLDGRMLLTNIPGMIEDVFADSSMIRMGNRIESRTQSLIEIEMYLTEEARRAEQWI
jgi:hypothetical protein